MYQLTLHLDYIETPRAEAALEYLADTVSWFEEPGQKTASAEEFAPRWIVHAIFREKPDLKEIKAALKTMQCRYRSIKLEKMPQTDWLKKNRESFAPIRAGRFYVHPSDKPETPAATLPIVIDAATAFGTGQHATTYGCLLAIDRIARHFRPRRVLDMGCGTAILAMATARIFPYARFLAADIDREAVRVSRQNARVNRLHPVLPCVQSPGFAASLVKKSARYDLILANILAKPLALMAGDMRRYAAPGAFVVLSGLLSGQERRVAAAYARHGFRFCGRIARDGWHSLIFRA